MFVIPYTIAKLVANLVLKRADTGRPEWRYRAGEDVKKLFEGRTKIDNSEFEQLISELLQN
ncbi:MAG: hypothetical protein WBL68_10660 [Nitrososphaeraceae archaeon]